MTDQDREPLYFPDDRMLTRLGNDFTYHAPRPGQGERYEDIRTRARDFAMFLAHLTPPSREQSLAFTALEESVFWANAAIARNE